VLAGQLGVHRLVHLDDLPEVDLADEHRPSLVVLCTWSAPCAAAHALDIADDAFRIDVERPLARWILGLARLVRWCTDGGSVVVVVERPAGLDTPGRSAQTMLAEGLIAYARSLAHSEGARGVRVNTVTTALHTAPDVLLGQRPPLATFPGRVDVEIAGAVRMLLGSDACGVTGAMLHADCGRSW
jgi:NAD(P)-dependent dehydrogenase (short-subunit alcohol dehydrogenase family)